MTDTELALQAAECSLGGALLLGSHILFSGPSLFPLVLGLLLLAVGLVASVRVLADTYKGGRPAAVRGDT